MTGLSIAVCVGCLLLSAYFSGSETAYLSFNRIRMKTMAEDNKRARLVMKLEQRYDKVISTLLVGNNLVNIAMTSLATLLFLGWFPANGATISTIVITVAVLIFGEVSPKTLAKEHADQVMLATAPLLNFFVVLLTPLTLLFGGLQTLLTKCFRSRETEAPSEEEMRTFVDEAEEAGGITKEEGDLIRSAIEFNDRDVEEILTPRVSIAAVEENDDRETIAQKFRETGFSRLPVYADTIDNILGIIHEKDFFAAPADRPLTEILTPALCVPPHMKISDLLRKLQQEQNHIAVVVDEFGGTEGIVTLEDVLEELVGEIWDEHDTVTEFFRKTGENTFRVKGDADLHEFLERLGEEDETCDAVTVGGWVMEKLGNLPEPGDRFQYGRLTVTVTKTEQRRVTEIEVYADETPPEER